MLRITLRHVVPLPRLLRRRLACRAAPVAVVLALAGCRDVAPAFGPTPAAARTNADALTAAVAFRFTDVYRAPKFEHARGRMGKHALAPSRLFGDSSVWTSTGPGERSLVVDGALAGGRYVFVPVIDAPTPDVVGDTRHALRLRRIGDGEYAWDTDVQFAVGSVRADDLAAVLAALLRAAEGRDEAALRADYRTSFPRTTAALGRLLALDTLRTDRDGHGATRVTLGASMHPDRLRARFPAFAAYLRKYAVPTRYRFTLVDRNGARWLDAAGAKGRLGVQVRTVGGRLVSLDGAPRPLPDSLRLRMELYAKFMIFTVGVSDLVADFAVLRAPHERGWRLRFTREPEWHLPLFTRRLLRSPLRRPFEQGGTTFELAIRDRPGAQTLVERRLSVPVKESAIVRWLGSLGGAAMSEFTGQAEAEENRFTADAFNALRADLRLLTGPAPAAVLAPKEPTAEAVARAQPPGTSNPTSTPPEAGGVATPSL